MCRTVDNSIVISDDNIASREESPDDMVQKGLK
jgi:hypothetical protein